MFTGIIIATGRLVSIAERGGDLELGIVTNGLHAHHQVGLARFLIDQFLTTLKAGRIIQAVQ